jgi:diguanylate cyclase (GGDEF)-like protein/PAS domain S-box-containing protein
VNAADGSPAEYETLLQFLYLAPVGLAQTTLDGEIVMINPTSARLLMSVSGHGGLTNLFTALEGVAPDLRGLAASFAPLEGVVCDGRRIQVQAGIRGKLEAQVLSLSLVKLLGNHLMAVLSDVTEQVLRERLLKQNEAWLGAIFTGITDYVVATLDGAGRLDDWNTSIGRVTGFSRDEVVGQPFTVFYPPDATTTPDRALQRLHEADANGWSFDDGWRVKADGTRFWGSAMISPLRERADRAGAAPGTADGTDDGPAYSLVMRDITDRREARERLRGAGSRDRLTGIANRRTLGEAAELEIIRWRHSPGELSLILIEIDDFAQLNDSHGRPAGDAVLRSVAAVLTGQCRERDVVARVGDAQFAVLLPSTGPAAAARVDQRLREAIASQPVLAGGLRIGLTVSSGVAAMDDPVADLDALLERAGRGRNTTTAGGPDSRATPPAVAAITNDPGLSDRTAT